jgi:hypothetical protein
MLPLHCTSEQRRWIRPWGTPPPIAKIVICVGIRFAGVISAKIKGPPPKSDPFRKIRIYWQATVKVTQAILSQIAHYGLGIDERLMIHTVPVAHFELGATTLTGVAWTLILTPVLFITLVIALGEQLLGVSG